VQILELFLILLVCILVSALLDQIIPKVSLPLVQIALGLAVTVATHFTLDITMDPQLFLVLLIAPLLFDESRHANRKLIWRDKASVASLAVGLVVATMFAVGFALNLIIPSIPLAAAFALGAAVGPTDATAVYALAKDVSLTKRQDALLNTEALVNDASGVVSFQFAVAAAVTGAFSVVDAGISFLWQFFAGVGIGLAVAWAGSYVLRILRTQDLETERVHLIVEVLMPFITYLAASAVGASGILAVVAAGLTAQTKPKRRSAHSARLKIASAAVWDFISFVINGIVFTLLGMQLPVALLPSWRSPNISNFVLVGAALAVVAVVIVVRFAWCLAMEVLRKNPATGARHGFDKAAFKNALLMTLAGPKGAITLSIAFTIPYLTAAGGPFPERNAIIFIACCVIIITLVLATFVVPLVSPAPEEDEKDGQEQLAQIRMLESVVARMEDAPANTAEQDAARTLVVRNYQDRIARLRRELVNPAIVCELRLSAIERQREYISDVVAQGTVKAPIARRYDRRLANLERMIERVSHVKPTTDMARKHRANPFSAGIFSFFTRLIDDMSEEDVIAQTRALAEQCELAAIEYLEARSHGADGGVVEAAQLLMADHESILGMLRYTDDVSMPATSRPFISAERIVDHETGEPVAADAVRRLARDLYDEAIRLELSFIDEMADEDEISHAYAAELKDEVHLLQLGSGQPLT
jgi:CPA1 family monovalent cation:H+ antiporter